MSALGNSRVSGPLSPAAQNIAVLGASAGTGRGIPGMDPAAMYDISLHGPCFPVLTKHVRRLGRGPGDRNFGPRVSIELACLNLPPEGPVYDERSLSDSVSRPHLRVSQGNWRSGFAFSKFREFYGANLKFGRIARAGKSGHDARSCSRSCRSVRARCAVGGLQ